MWKEIQVVPSSDTNVSKFIFTNERAVAEGVLYKYPTYEERTVMCISTQSGCPVGCRFCGAGDYFVRSLTPEEIVSQVSFMMEEKDIDPATVKRGQIMFMSMGEPMLNWQALKPALYMLYQMFPNFALLISTMAPAVPHWADLMRVSVDIPTVGLQFSLHEIDQDARNKLIPFRKKLSIQDIRIAGLMWQTCVGRKPFINYCVTEKNNSLAEATEIVEQFPPHIWEYTISVVCERDEHVAAANRRQRELAQTFMAYLVELGGSVRIFDPAGQDDIGGGCGQLWYVQDWMKTHPELAIPSVGHGLPSVHTPREV